MPPLDSSQSPRRSAFAPVGVRAGKSAFSVSEKFGFEQRFGERAAVDGDERFIAARRVLMNGARDEFFARSRFAQNQNGRARRRGASDFLIQFNHLRRSSDHRARSDFFRRNFFLFLFLFERAFRRAQNFVDFERLGYEIPSAFARRLDRRFERAEAGYENDRRFFAQSFQ